MPELYIISGCNGAGKTTASFTVLPKMLNCQEFINADEIAKGLAPLMPEKAAIEAGRIMLTKIDKLIQSKTDFAFETTLATKSYTKTILKAQKKGYNVTLLFFWLDSVQLAIERVQTRVKEGGHNIPIPVIKRRYSAGIKNLFQLYIPICNYWMIFNNSTLPSELIADGYKNENLSVENSSIFAILNNLANGQKK